MIKAKFVKAEPTKDGITIILKAEKSKENMRLAVDLMDEECLLKALAVAPDWLPIDGIGSIEEELLHDISPIIVQYAHKLADRKKANTEKEEQGGDREKVQENHDNPVC